MFKLKNIAVTLTTGTLLLNTFSPAALAATDIQITGNGSGSENEVKIEAERSATITQNNTARITNEVETKSSSGGNSASDNTGGDVLILTGDAKSKVDLLTKVNLNKADLAKCNTCSGDLDVLISGNGSESENEVKVESETEASIFQDNNANIQNEVETKTDSGQNEADRNTGGDTTIVTGKADAKVNVENMANANIAKMDASNNNGASSAAEASIVGNGSGSENEILFDLDHVATVVQDNRARIENEVEVRTESGQNSASDNTGGDVLISTGRAMSDVMVDNKANFNGVSTDCGCLLDTEAKISGNGSESENEIESEIDSELAVFQDNVLDLLNEVENKAETGQNEADRNTGPAVIDPVDILTGNAEFATTIENWANANFHGGQGLSLPGGITLSFHFDLGGLFGH